MKIDNCILKPFFKKYHSQFIFILIKLLNDLGIFAFSKNISTSSFIFLLTNLLKAKIIVQKETENKSIAISHFIA